MSVPECRPSAVHGSGKRAPPVHQVSVSHGHAEHTDPATAPGNVALNSDSQADSARSIPVIRSTYIGRCWPNATYAAKRAHNAVRTQRYRATGHGESTGVTENPRRW